MCTACDPDFRSAVPAEINGDGSKFAQKVNRSASVPHRAIEWKGMEQHIGVPVP